MNCLLNPVVQEVIYRLFSEVGFRRVIVHGSWFALAGKKGLGWKNWIEAMPLRVQRIDCQLLAVLLEHSQKALVIVLAVALRATDLGVKSSTWPPCSSSAIPGSHCPPFASAGFISSTLSTRKTSRSCTRSNFSWLAIKLPAASQKGRPPGPRSWRACPRCGAAGRPWAGAAFMQGIVKGCCWCILKY